MIFSISIIVAVLAAAIQAQECASIASLVPTCATSCLESAASALGCSATDYICHCGIQASAIAKAATPCVLKGCGMIAAMKVKTSALAVCSCVSASTTLAEESISTQPGDPVLTASEFSSKSGTGNTETMSVRVTIPTNSSVATSSPSSTTSMPTSVTSFLPSSSDEATTSTSASSSDSTLSSSTTTTNSESSSATPEAAAKTVGIKGSILAIFGGLLAFL